MTAAERIAVCCQADAEEARRRARMAGAVLGFSSVEQEAVALATMELATNLVRYARGGEIHIQPVSGPAGSGLRLESRDTGPGIADVERALVEGFSTGGGMGEGLPAVRRLMDSFEIASTPERTTIVACKWPARR
jgi:serine/threonine-protein kinase RsbT